VGHGRSPPASASRILEDETARPSSLSSATPSTLNPLAAPRSVSTTRFPIALYPNVKFEPITAWRAFDPSNEHLLHELLGRPLREVLVELQHQELVDPQRIDQRSLALQGGQELRLGARRVDLAGMPFECDPDGGQPVVPGHVDRPAEHGLVPPVHAVEEPDRDRRLLADERERTDAAKDLHWGARVQEFRPGPG